MKNFKLIMESWRGYKKINERKEPMAARNFKQALDFFEDQLANTTLIFFDTETTGLQTFKKFPIKRNNQITQIAAVAIQNLFSAPFEEVMSSDVDSPGSIVIGVLEDRIQLTPEMRRVVEDEEELVNWIRNLPPEEVPKKTIKRRTGEVEEIPAYEEARPEYKTTKEIFGMTNYDPNATNLIPLEDALKNFVEFINRYPERKILAQNSPFDVKFANSAFKMAGLESPDEGVLDTVDYFRAFLLPVIEQYKQISEGEQSTDPVKSQIIKDIKNVKLETLSNAFGVSSTKHHEAIADVVMLYKVLRSVFEFLKKEEAAFQISVPEPKPEPSPEEKAAKAAKDREYYAKQDAEQAKLYSSLWDRYRIK
jgi:DNA polymerase III epsilon subunit-like protein